MSQILVRVPRNVHEALKDEAHHRRRTLQGLCLETLIDVVQHRLPPPVAEAACEPPVTDNVAGESQMSGKALAAG